MNKAYRICVLFLFLYSSLVQTAADCPVHYLKPPKLGIEHLGARMLCHRPMRQGGMPNLSISLQEDLKKIIAHNYGHGGSGWTLAPGCVQHQVEAFNRMKPEKDTSIVIIGAGVMGLLTAYMLIQSGYKNIVMIAEQFEDITSHKAGGFCAPTSASPKAASPEEQALMQALCVNAYRFYAEVARGEHPDIDTKGARYVPVYMRRNETRMQAYEGTVMEIPEDIIVDFSNGKRYEMKVYRDAIFMDTGRLMASLFKAVKDKVAIMRKRVHSFEEVESSCIFNCAGLGARVLNDDTLVTSGQGHQIVLRSQQPDEIDYMIGFQADEGMTEAGQAVRRSVYLFPKHVPGTPETSVGVLGGTYIEGADESTPNEKEFDLLVERARDFFGE